MNDTAPPSAGAVRALAHQLLAWADHLADGHEPEAPDRTKHLLALALELREARRRRMRLFPRVPLGNTTWEVLLDLFIEELHGIPVSLHQLALAGDHPAPSVYDSAEMLERLGLIERKPDPADSTGILVVLTVTARHGLYELFEQSAESVGPILPDALAP
jgi:DNA-binding MarR family transcriptional regulator